MKTIKISKQTTVSVNETSVEKIQEVVTPSQEIKTKNPWSMVKRVIIFLSIAATITINVLANIVPYNGKLTGAISDSFQVFFVPAGYVFAIWGLIYFMLAGFAIYQLTNRTDKIIDDLFFPIVLSSVANSVWIFLWHYNQEILSPIAMLVLLICLIYIYIKTRKIKAQPVFNIFVRNTFSVYLGWISVATIANITVFLNIIKFDGLGLAGEVWCAILIGVAALLSAIIILRERDTIFPLVIVWAIIGIVIKFLSFPVIFITGIVAAALISMFILAERYRTH